MPGDTAPLSAETCPVVVQPPTNSMPEFTVKHTMKRKAYVLVPPAPYRFRLSHQGSHNNRRIQANSSTSVPLVIQELQPTVNKPEQRVPPSQVDNKSHSNRKSQANSSTSVPLVIRDGLQPTIDKTEQRMPPSQHVDVEGHSNWRSQANSSTSVPLMTGDELQRTVNMPEQRPSQVDGKVPITPSDIGISIPTTVRRPGSFIIHTFPHVIAQSTGHIVEPVNPRTKSPHVGNPVTAQVITKGSTKKSISTFKFKKSKVKSTPSSSNNTTVVANTDTQGGPKSSRLPQPQPQPKPSMPNPEVSSNDVTELASLTKVMEKVVDLMLVSNYLIYSLNVADYSCDRFQTVIPNSTTVHPDSTMALLTFMTPNSTLTLPSSTLNTTITITPLPFKLCNIALNNAMINAHSTTALIPISIINHTFILSVIIKFHITRPHIRQSNSPRFIKTCTDPHRSKIRCSLQARWHM